MTELAYNIKTSKSHLFNDLKLRALDIEHQYNIEIAKLNNEGAQILADYEQLRAKARADMKFEWTITSKPNAKQDIFYTIKRTPSTILQGDEDYCKTIEYCSFKIVNGVLITNGGGYQLKVENGTILSTQNIIDIESSIVPDIFK